MASFKKLIFRPKWQHKDPQIRRQAVTESHDQELLDELPEIARNDESATVRLAATKRLNDLYHLMRIAEADRDAQVRETAERRWLAMLCDEQPCALDNKERLELVRKLEQAQQLKYVLSHADDEAFRLAVLPRVTQQGLLGEIALNDRSATVREQAAQQITQASTLSRVMKLARKRDKRIYRLLKDRHDQQARSDDDQQTAAEKAEQLLSQLDALVKADQPLSDKQKSLNILSQQWTAVDATDQQTEHFSNASQILRTAIAGPQPASQSPLEDAAKPIDDQSNKQSPLQPLLQRALRAAEKKRVDGKDLTTLRKAWQAQWNNIKRPSAADDRTHDQFEGAMGKLTERVQTQTEQQTAALARIDTELEQVEQALESGDLSKSVTAVRQFNQSHRLIGAHRHTSQKSFKSRMNQARSELHRLRDWQHWSNNKIRQRLCEEAESIVGSGMHPDAVAEKVKTMQAQWKQLDQSEKLPGDNPKRQPAPGLNRRFRAICNQAFKPAKAFFEKRSEVRGQHEQEMTTMLDQMTTLAEQSQPDLQQAERLIGRAYRAQRELGGLAPRARGKMSKALREGAAALDRALDDQYAVIERRKQRIIDEVTALVEEPDLEQAISQAKAAQQRWQQAGRTRRRREQSLWKTYRAAADAVFNRLGEQRQQEQAQRSEAREQQQAVIDEVNQLLGWADDKIVEATEQLPKLQDRWRELGSTERRLEQQFLDRCRKLELRAEEITQREQSKQRGQHHELLLRCIDAETKLLAGQAIEATTWQQMLPSEQDNLPRALRDRLGVINDWINAPPDDTAALTQQLTDNQSALEALCIEVEFLAGVESPEAFSQQRMDYQVQRLARRMGGGETKDRESEISELELRWLACGPLPTDSGRALNQRFKAAFDQLVN